MTPRQKELVEVIEAADDWVPILSLRSLFQARTIMSAVEEGLILFRDGYIGPKSLERDALDDISVGVDVLLQQPIGRGLAEAARMMEQTEA
jgi:hypothetical protein